MTKLFFDRSEQAAIYNMKIYFRVCTVLALLGAALRSAAYVTSFDSEVGYFNGSLLPALADWTIVAACVFAVSGFIFINNKGCFPSVLDSSENTVFFSSVFAGFILTADFAYKLFVMIGEDKFEYYSFIFDKMYRSDNAYLVRVTALIEIFGAISALLAAIWFFVRSSKKANDKACAILGFFPVIRALSGIATVYFDMQVQMNHPSKLVLQLALITVMLYFLCEERFVLPDTDIHPRRYFVCGCVASVICIAGGSSEMIGFFSGRLLKGAFCVEAFFCLTVGIYILARMGAFVKVAGNTQITFEKNSESVESEE